MKAAQGTNNYKILAEAAQAQKVDLSSSYHLFTSMPATLLHQRLLIPAMSEATGTKSCPELSHKPSPLPWQQAPWDYKAGEQGNRVGTERNLGLQME